MSAWDVFVQLYYVFPQALRLVVALVLAFLCLPLLVLARDGFGRLCGALCGIVAYVVIVSSITQ